MRARANTHTHTHQHTHTPFLNVYFLNASECTCFLLCNICVICKTDVGSDHDWVLMILKLKLKSNNKKTALRICFNLNKLEDQTFVEQFQAQIGKEFY